MLVFLPFHLFAEEGERSLLIFRNTGEITIVNCDELDSIAFSSVDAEGVEHGRPVSEVFYSNGSTETVPLEEIDSIVFGGRNVVEYQKNVVIIDEAHRNCITGYDGTQLTYSPATPSGVMPCVGTVLFYGNRDEFFPAGFAARVVAVDGLVVKVEDVGLEEVFSQLYFAGTVECIVPASAKAKWGKEETFEKTYEINETMSLFNFASIEVNAPVKVLGHFLLDPLKFYHHADFSVDIDLSTVMKVHLIQNEATEEDLPDVKLIKLDFPKIGCVLWPSVEIMLFAELAAELNGSLTSKRNFHYGWSWTRDKGKDSFTKIPATQDGAEKHGKAENGAELTLDGSLFCGPKLVFDIGVFKQAGVELDVKAAPYLEGSFGLGALQKLKSASDGQDLQEPWAQAKLSTALRVALEGKLYHPKFLSFERKEYTVWEPEPFDFFKQELDLLPKFLSPCAIGYPKKEEPKPAPEPLPEPQPVVEPEVTDVTMAVKDEAELVAPVEVGFEIVGSDGAVLDSLFVEPTPQTLGDSIRAYAGELKVGEGIEGLTMRPVVHYAGNTLHYLPTPVNSGAAIQPYNAYASNGVAAMVSGSTVVGQKTVGGNTYVVGNFLPVPVRDPMYVAPCPIPVPDDGRKPLKGTWFDAEDNITLVFTTDSLGTIKEGDGEELEFAYTLDTPQTGDLVMRLEDGTVRVYTVVYCNERLLVLFNKEKKQTCQFVAQGM